MEPLISICIPVYNGIAYLSEAIESVLKQTYETIEVVIQDNASSDGTWDLLITMAQEDHRLRIARNSRNIGVVPNWNKVVEQAEGDYIAVLSADDLLRPEFVSRCLGVFTSHRADIVSTYSKIMDMRYGKPILRSWAHRVANGDTDVEDVVENALKYDAFNINAAMFSRRAIQVLSDDGSVFQNGSNADYELFLRAGMRGLRIRYIAEPLGIYRMHAGSWSQRNKLRMNADRLLVLARLGLPLLRRHPCLYLCRVWMHLRRVAVLGGSHAKRVLCSSVSWRDGLL